MAKNTQLTSLEEVITKCRANFAQLIEQAESRLEAARLEHAETIAKSEAGVAELENHLEMLEAFEQDRRAALARQELATAIEAHKGTVNLANWKLKHAMKQYVQTHAAGGVAMECAFNAAAGLRE